MMESQGPGVDELNFVVGKSRWTLRGYLTCGNIGMAKEKVKMGGYLNPKECARVFEEIQVQIKLQVKFLRYRHAQLWSHGLPLLRHLPIAYAKRP